MEIILGGQGKKDATKGLVASGSTDRIANPGGITEDTCKMSLEQFNNQASKDFAVRY